MIISETIVGIITISLAWFLFGARLKQFTSKYFSPTHLINFFGISLIKIDPKKGKRFYLISMSIVLIITLVLGIWILISGLLGINVFD